MKTNTSLTYAQVNNLLQRALEKIRGKLSIELPAGEFAADSPVGKLPIESRACASPAGVRRSPSRSPHSRTRASLSYYYDLGLGQLITAYDKTKYPNEWADDESAQLKSIVSEINYWLRRLRTEELPRDEAEGGVGKKTQ